LDDRLVSSRVVAVLTLVTLSVAIIFASALLPTGL
jgi:hypothetical protein